MELIKELTELKDTIANEIAQANKEIKKAGGDLNSGDIEMIDKLTHSMKSLVTTCAMLEAEDDGGYSERYMPYYSRDDGHTRRNSYGGRNGSGNYGRGNKNKTMIIAIICLCVAIVLMGIAIVVRSISGSHSSKEKETATEATTEVTTEATTEA
ncbi:MAG: hypothetical protein IIY28_09605, partial [Lachnospiraceae bacterium]|nr:hypothetical protein [Lachnospiraceae bacterium]